MAATWSCVASSPTTSVDSLLAYLNKASDVLASHGTDNSAVEVLALSLQEVATEDAISGLERCVQDFVPVTNAAGVWKEITDVEGPVLVSNGRVVALTDETVTSNDFELLVEFEGHLVRALCFHVLVGTVVYQWYDSQLS